MIKSPSFIPDNDDILHSRVRTSGIIAERLAIEDTIVYMYDIGGRRNRWIHCFEGTNVVFFVASLSDYDQSSWENPSTNSLVRTFFFLIFIVLTSSLLFRLMR